MRKIFCDHCGNEIPSVNIKNPNAKKPVKEVEIPGKDGKLICKIINCTTDDICQDCFIKYILKHFGETPPFSIIPNEDQIRDACLYSNHSFGIMEEEDKHRIILSARHWFEVWSKVYQDTKETQINISNKL